MAVISPLRFIALRFGRNDGNNQFCKVTKNLIQFNIFFKKIILFRIEIFIIFASLKIIGNF